MQIANLVAGVILLVFHQRLEQIEVALAIIRVHIVQEDLAQALGHRKAGHLMPGWVEETPAALGVGAEDHLLQIRHQQPILLLACAQGHLNLALLGDIAHGAEEICLTIVGDRRHADRGVVAVAIVAAMLGQKRQLVYDSGGHARGQLIGVPLRIPLAHMARHALSGVAAKHAQEGVIGVDQAAGMVEDIDAIG